MGFVLQMLGFDLLATDFLDVQKRTGFPDDDRERKHGGEIRARRCPGF